MLDPVVVNSMIDLLQFASTLTALKKKLVNEWEGPCPTCGGVNRFVVNTQKNRWLCRHCTDGKWRDGIALVMMVRNCTFKQACEQIQGQQPLTPAEREKLAREQAERAAKELADAIERANKTLKELREAQSWLRYHDQLDKNEQARELWRQRGVPDVYQDLFSFGWEPHHAYRHGEDLAYSPTLTIPVFSIGGQCEDVRHRLLQPISPTDKYRPERAGLHPRPWLADPSLTRPASMLIVEGEIKGAVSYLTADNPKMQVAGMPGKNTGYEALGDYLDSVDGPIIICPDPGKQELAMAKADCAAIGSRARLLELPGKIDDLITGYGLDKDWMKSALRQARKVV